MNKPLIVGLVIAFLGSGLCAATEPGKNTFRLTDSGLGPITLGMKVVDVPQSVEGLYDRIETVSAPDCEQILFYSGDNVMFDAGYDEIGGTIFTICLSDYSTIPNATTDNTPCIGGEE